MDTNRTVVDCRKFPSETNCSLLIAGTEEEVLAIALDHAVSVHKHERTPRLREDLRGLLEKESVINPEIERRNRELALSIYEAFNRRDYERLESFADTNATLLNVATQEVFRGPKGVRGYAEAWIRAFPDAKVEVDRITASAEGFVAEFIASGTHKGVLSSPMGSLQPTGRRLRLRFAEAGSVRNGKTVDVRAYFDLASLLTQLGVWPEPMTRPAPIDANQSRQH